MYSLHNTPPSPLVPRFIFSPRSFFSVAAKRSSSHFSFLRPLAASSSPPLSALAFSRAAVKLSKRHGERREGEGGREGGGGGGGGAVPRKGGGKRQGTHTHKARNRRRKEERSVRTHTSRAERRRSGSFSPPFGVSPCFS